MLLGELVSDAARELYRRRIDNVADRQSAAIRDAPSVNNILLRLQQMEMEQDMIRQRWTTIVYDDRSSVQPGNVYRGDGTLPDRGAISNSHAIVFTKPGPGGSHRVTEMPSRLRSELGDNGNLVAGNRSAAHTVLRLSRESIESIERNVEKYEKFLRDRSHHVDSIRFNPWTAVERIADDILEVCINDVVKELDEINSDIVDRVYNAEFSIA
jgi:hypothetical protein